MNEVTVTLVVVIPSQEHKGTYEIKKIPGVLINLEAPFARIRTVLINKLQEHPLSREWASQMDAGSFEMLISAREGTPRGGVKLEEGAMVLLFPLYTEEEIVRFPA